MSVAKLLRSVFFGFAVYTLRLMSPRVESFAIDPTSVEIRQGDPVKQVAGGRIVRCTPADTAILGFAAEGQNSYLPTSIASISAPTDAAGNPIINVYVADVDTVFTGACKSLVAVTDALRTQVHDLAYAIATGSTPTGVVNGTTGATTYSYTTTAITANGESTAGTAYAPTNGNAALSAVNSITLTIPFQDERVIQYNIYRGNLLIANIAADRTGNAVTYTDTGIAAIGGAAPTVNMTGWVINDTANATGIVKIDAIDTKPQLPGRVNRHVQFHVPASVSQWQGVAGS